MALVGINHVALEVGSIDEALAFWEGLFGPLQLRGRSGSMAFVDMGDQFVALMRAPHGKPDRRAARGDRRRRQGAVRGRRSRRASTSRARRRSMSIPWGDLLQVVDYREIQFTKAPEILAGMGVARLEKNDSALGELRAKGLGRGLAP